MSPRERPRGRGERGSTTVLVIGFALMLLLGIAVVVDASAAFLHRQRLHTLADGAALQGADLGVRGREIYDVGVGVDPLGLNRARAEAAVRDYLVQVGAHRAHPGLTAQVSLDGDRVVVRLSSPLELPLTVPGTPSTAIIGATGSAVVQPD